jgi:hypothetical protein
MSPEMKELFEYTLSKQAEWAILYRKQQAKLKLQKNRNEKQKVKDKLLNNTIANDIITKVIEIKNRN